MKCNDMVDHCNCTLCLVNPWGFGTFVHDTKIKESINAHKQKDTNRLAHKNTHSQFSAFSSNTALVTPSNIECHPPPTYSPEASTQPSNLFQLDGFKQLDAYLLFFRTHPHNGPHWSICQTSTLVSMATLAKALSREFSFPKKFSQVYVVSMLDCYLNLLAYEHVVGESYVWTWNFGSCQWKLSKNKDTVNVTTISPVHCNAVLHHILKMQQHRMGIRFV